MPVSKMLAYLNIGHFLDHYFLMIFPLAALAIERQWNIGYGEALALGTPLYVGFALGTLPAGWLGDKCKREYLIAILFLGGGFSSIFIAVASDTFYLMVGLGALGLSTSIYHPVGLAMVTGLSDKPGRALAINGVYGNMGLAAASLATGFLADYVGWRSAFLIPGLVAVMVGGFYLVACRNAGSVVDRQTSTTPHRLLASAVSDRYRVLAVVMIAALFGGLIFNGVTVSLPKLFELRVAGVADQLASVGAYSALVFAVAAFAQLPVGDLLDRLGARPVLTVLLLGQSVLLLVIAQVEGFVIIPLAMILVLLMFAEIPVTGWLVGRYIPAGWRARVFSVEYVLSLGMNALVVPMIALLYTWGIGFEQLYTGFAVSAAVVLAAVALLPRMVRNRLAQACNSPRNPG